MKALVCVADHIGIIVNSKNEIVKGKFRKGIYLEKNPLWKVNENLH